MPFVSRSFLNIFAIAVSIFSTYQKYKLYYSDTTDYSIHTMTDIFSKRDRSKIMSAVRSTRNKSTEGKLAKLFRKI